MKFLAAALLMVIVSFASASAGSLLKLTILHMNDIHGHYLPFRGKDEGRPVGGLARARTVMRRIVEENRASGRETVILFAGDLLTGTPFTMVFRGKLGIELMNRMGFQAMTVGNHDFDQGVPNLMSRLRSAARFPLLGANVVRTGAMQPQFSTCPSQKSTYGGRRPLLSVMNLITAGSRRRIRIMGLITPDTPRLTLPKNVAGVGFIDPVKRAQVLTRSLRDKDFVIALTHLGVEGDKRLAGSCPKIDVIVGGHSHTALFHPLKVGRCLIVQAGAYAQYVGRLDIDVLDGRVVRSRGELIPLRPSVERDRAIASLLEKYSKSMDARFGEVIGRTEVFLEGGMKSVRSGRNTNFGVLMAYLVARNVHATIGLINGGSIRASIPEGPVTLKEVYTALPFRNRPVRFELKGEDLRALLQRSVDLPEGSGGKLQTYGVSYGIREGRVTVDRVGGKDFRPDGIYTVATNDFLASGGDGYDLFKRKGMNRWRGQHLVSGLLVDLLRERGVITREFLEKMNRLGP